LRVFMRRLRVSAISFLNTAPLMWDFEHGDRRDFDISYTVPSFCADALQRGAADIGIIPAITYATVPDLLVLADVAIAARGPVRSILLISHRPLEEVRTIATDSSSRTSVVLLRVLLERRFGGARRLVTMDPDLPRMLAGCDAALLIGDRALRVDRNEYVVYDLAAEWQQMTGKPFVFAFWAVRMAALSDFPREADLPRIFRDSRDHGLEPHNLAQLARQWAPRVGLNETEVQSYLTGNIHYFLDPGALDGLDLFFRYAAECGAIPQVPELRLLGASVSALVR
jgi:chorismate dehydratase